MCEPGQAHRLRDALVDQLLARGVITRGAIEAALRTVPRHQFLPRVSLRKAYADNAVVTRRDVKGSLVSSASQPTMVAIMLNQLRVRRGDRVLEIGAGTGYNAALLDELVGPDGAVATIDIDADVVHEARRALGRTGHGRVQVIEADGELGYPAGAPYDRLIVTAGAADLPPAWSEQLTPGARMVVPLQVCGSTRNIAFVRSDRGWRSESTGLCGFIPMRGLGRLPIERVGVLASPEVDLVVVGEPPLDRLTLTDALDRALDRLGTICWTDVRLRLGDSIDDLQLFLALHAPGYATLDSARPVADIEQLQRPLGDGRVIITSDAFGYVVGRTTDEGERQVGGCAYGRGAQSWATWMAGQITLWDAHHRRAMSHLVVDVVPAATPQGKRPAGLGIATRHNHLVVSWPGWSHVAG